MGISFKLSCWKVRDDVAQRFKMLSENFKASRVWAQIKCAISNDLDGTKYGIVREVDNKEEDCF